MKKQRGKINGFRQRYIAVATVSVGIGLSAWACRIPSGTDNKTDAADGLIFKSPEEKKLEADVDSFDGLRADVNGMNQSEGSKAADKLAKMWERIVATKQDDDKIVPPVPGTSPIVFGNGSPERFWRIFTGFAVKDGGSEVRPNEKVPDILKSYIRLTHRYSVFAKLKYIPTEAAKSLYTGQYAQGNANILGRFSSAVPPSVPDRFTPAFSSKFFLDGKNESQVLITQHDVGGQSFGKDRIYNNFWEKPLSNRLEFENGVLSGVGAFSRFLYTARYFSKVFNFPYTFDPRELQADHLSQFTPDGKAVAKAKGPRFVWSVAGTPGLKSYFAQFDKPGADYRNMFLSLNQKTDAVPGSGQDDGGITVMRLYGSDTWTYNPEKDATLIGTFVTTSKFVASDAADQRLFFRHSISFLHYNGVEAGSSLGERFSIQGDKAHRLLPGTDGADYAQDEYTQDYPMARWATKPARDVLFTGDCRLGVKEDEVQPFPWKDSLNGTYIAKAVLTHRDADGNLCAPKVIADMASKAKKDDKVNDASLPAKAVTKDIKSLSDGEKKSLSDHIKSWFNYTNAPGNTL